jgi:hypothetical protein
MNSERIVFTSQLALGFLTVFADSGIQEAQDLLSALVKISGTVRLMIHDEAQYETPPTILGDIMASVYKSHPEVAKVCKRVAEAIFGAPITLNGKEVVLSERNFVQNILDTLSGYHNARDYFVRRFGPEVMDALAKSLHGVEIKTADGTIRTVDRYDLTSDEVHAINAAAELIPTKKGTDHNYDAVLGIIEMNNGSLSLSL